MDDQPCWSDIPVDQWLTAAGLSPNEIMHQAAINPECPATVLALLAQHPDWDVRMRVAGNRSCSGEVLEQLAGDPNLVVRSHVASRDGLTMAALQSLSRDPSMWLAVAGNPNTDVTTLLNLSKRYRIDRVQMGRLLAQHPNCPPAALHDLGVRGDLLVKTEVALNPATCAPTLAWLAYDNIIALDDIIGRHPNTSPETLRYLVTGISVFAVREAVATNPNTPPDVLGLLFEDSIPQIRQAALHNPNCPDHIRAIIALGAYD